MKIPILIAAAVYLGAAVVYNGETAVFKFENSVESSLKHTTVNNIALFPIPYNTKTNKVTLYIDGKKIDLKIKQKRYPFERLRVENKKITYDKNIAQRVAKEYKEASKIYNTVTNRTYIKGPFILPINSKITSEYGTARIFNGKLKSFHSGVDFKAPIGTEIAAINGGEVVLAKDRYLAGKTVIIDHGKGVYSCYYHLSEISVKKGDLVKKGEIVGRSGKSGRVTGPHLHLTIKIAGESVDPMQFIDSFNAIYDHRE